MPNDRSCCVDDHRFSARHFRLATGLVLAAVVVGWLADQPARAEESSRTPNIVLVLADDLGYGDLGCYNAQSKIPTPHLDRLASQGRRFTDAHSPSGVCTPTRYGLLTGRYCWRTTLKRGVLWGESPALIDTERLTLPRLLQEAGYVTGGFGKWHLGLGTQQPVDYTKPLRPSPLDYGFQTYFGIPASLDMVPYVYLRDDRAVAPPTETVAASQMRRHGGGGFWRGGGMAADFRHIDVLPLTVRETVAFIHKATGTIDQQPPGAADAVVGRKPFFAYVPFSAPHTPWLPTDEFRGRSQAGYYGDFVMQVDDAVGQILAALDQAGVADDTLVIVTSDNGAHWLPSDIEEFGHRANGPWRGQKSDIHEGGHRVPLLIRWPGRVPAGSRSAALTCLTDILATCAAIVGKELPEDAGEDSINQLPHWIGDASAESQRPAVVHHSGDGLFAIRDGEWKLIEGLGSGGFTPPKTIEPAADGPRGQLYNLVEDPGETTNLYLQRPEIVARLAQQLETFRQQGRSRP